MCCHGNMQPAVSETPAEEVRFNVSLVWRREVVHVDERTDDALYNEEFPTLALSHGGGRADSQQQGQWVRPPKIPTLAKSPYRFGGGGELGWIEVKLTLASAGGNAGNSTGAESQDGRTQMNRDVLNTQPQPLAGRPVVAVPHKLSGAQRRKKKRLRPHDLDERLKTAREINRALLDVLGAHAGDGSYAARQVANFEKCVTCEGAEAAFRFVKKQAAVARAGWIMRGNRNDVAQYSYAGRALPEGTLADAEAALRRHHADMSTPWKTPGALLLAARTFAKNWANRYLASQKRLSKPDLPTRSACSESTLREGGLRGFVAGLGRHPDAEVHRSQLSTELPAQDVESLLEDLSYVYHARDLLQRGHPPSVAVALRERGLKIRVITKSSAALHLVGHIVRKRLLDGLRRDPRSASPLVGVTDEMIKKELLGALGAVLVSSDLTRASDLLPHDLMAAITDGLEASSRFTPLEIDALRLLTGSQAIKYPAELGLADVQSVRGILMGLPTTWAMLSLTHLFWWDQATRQASVVTRCPLSKLAPQTKVLICGDDAVAACPSAVADRYGSVLTACGGEKSAGKHFDCRQTPRRFVFLERLFTVQLDASDHVTSVHREPCVPLRGLVRPSVPDAFLEHGSALYVPEFVKQLYAIDTLVREFPALSERLLRYTRARPHLAHQAAALGLRRGLPLALGGDGLPVGQHTAGEQQQFDTWRKRAEILSCTQGFPALLRGIVDPLWCLASEMAAGDSSSFYADGTFVALPADNEDGPEVQEGADPYCATGLSQPELCEQTTISSYRSLFAQLGNSMTPRRPKLHQASIKRAVKRWWKKADSLVELDVPTETRVWIRRTRAPLRADGGDGALLFPVWSGPYRASEARRRSYIVGGVRLIRT